MEPVTNSPKENTSMALSGMILGCIGLICAAIPDWRAIGLGIAVLALGVSVFAISRLNRSGGRKVRAYIGIVLAIAAIFLATYFQFMRKPEEVPAHEPVPAELQHSHEQETDNTNALQTLEGITDSTSGTN